MPLETPLTAVYNYKSILITNVNSSSIINSITCLCNFSNSFLEMPMRNFSSFSVKSTQDTQIYLRIFLYYCNNITFSMPLSESLKRTCAKDYSEHLFDSFYESDVLLLG